jgi:hypothetical protein
MFLVPGVTHFYGTYLSRLLFQLQVGEEETADILIPMESPLHHYVALDATLTQP